MLHAVRSMDNKAGGADQVTVKLLKAGLPALASTLTYVINSSLSSGHVPSGWKKARPQVRANRGA